MSIDAAINTGFRTECFKKFQEGKTPNSIIEENEKEDFFNRRKIDDLDNEEIINHHRKLAILKYYDEYRRIENKKEEKEQVRDSIFSCLEKGCTQKQIMRELKLTRRIVSSYVKTWVEMGNVEPKEEKEVVVINNPVMSNKKRTVKKNKIKKSIEKEAYKTSVDNNYMIEKQEEFTTRTNIENNDPLENIVDSQKHASESKDSLTLASNLSLAFENREFDKKNDNTEDELEGPCIIAPLLKGVLVNGKLESRQLKKNQYRRGDIVFVNKEAFDPSNGIKFKSRPAVVIQNNDGNYHSNNLIVAYITSSLKKYNLPTHVLIKETPCLKESMVLGEQIQTVGKQYIYYVGKINDKEMKKVEAAIVASLGLEDYIDNLVKQECLRSATSKFSELEEEILKNHFDNQVLSDDCQTNESLISTKEVSDIFSENGFKITEITGKHYTYDLKNSIFIKEKNLEQLIDPIDKIDNLICELEKVKSIIKAQKR